MFLTSCEGGRVATWMCALTVCSVVVASLRTSWNSMSSMWSDSGKRKASALIFLSNPAMNIQYINRCDHLQHASSSPFACQPYDEKVHSMHWQGHCLLHCDGTLDNLDSDEPFTFASHDNAVLLELSLLRCACKFSNSSKLHFSLFVPLFAFCVGVYFATSIFTSLFTSLCTLVFAFHFALCRFVLRRFALGSSFAPPKVASLWMLRVAILFSLTITVPTTNYRFTGRADHRIWTEGGLWQQNTLVDSSWSFTQHCSLTLGSSCQRVTAKQPKAVGKTHRPYPRSSITTIAREMLAIFKSTIKTGLAAGRVIQAFDNLVRCYGRRI